MSKVYCEYCTFYDGYYCTNARSENKNRKVTRSDSCEEGRK